MSDFLETLIAAYDRMQPLGAAFDRWIRTAMVGMLVWLVVVFSLAYYSHPILSLVALLAAWPLLVLIYPQFSAAALAINLFDRTTVGAWLSKVRSTINKAAFSGGELAFTLGNDLNDIKTLDLNNPALIAVFFMFWAAGTIQRFSGRPAGAFSVLSVVFAAFLNSVNFSRVLAQEVDRLLRSFFV